MKEKLGVGKHIEGAISKMETSCTYQSHLSISSHKDMDSDDITNNNKCPKKPCTFQSQTVPSDPSFTIKQSAAFLTTHKSTYNVTPYNKPLSYLKI